MRVHFIENLDEIKPHLEDKKNTILDFSEAGELRYLFDEQFTLTKEPSILTCIFSLIHEGKGSFQMWDEMFKPESQIVLFNDPIAMSTKIHYWEALERCHKTNSIRSDIRAFMEWLETRRKCQNIYILCCRVSFIREMKF
jgi:hypothetical protein